MESYQSNPDGLRPGRRVCEIAAFVGGAAVLGTQMAVGTLLSSALGGSTVVWATTIAVVLVSLSVGYWLGGKLADRRPSLRGLSVLVLVAAAALAIAPLAMSELLDQAVGGGGGKEAAVTLPFIVLLTSGLALLVVPIALLGGIVPFATRLDSATLWQCGSVAGRYYSISTGGSLAGTFLTALVLTPALGPAQACLILALAVGLTGLWVLAASRKWAPGETWAEPSLPGAQHASARPLHSHLRSRGQERVKTAS